MDVSQSSSASASVSEALDHAPVSFFHLRAVFTAGMGFFTDAYDLFIIGSALALVTPLWHLTGAETGLLASATLIAAFLGAFVFGRLADILGRKAIYGLEATLMAVGALATAFAPNFFWLLIFRFLLGLGIGGDYPMSAVLMAEYANAKKRGQLVSMVFGMQALGLLAGPIVAMTLEASGMPASLIWRIMLGLGALPALAVIWLRRTMPESPRYTQRVLGDGATAARQIKEFSSGQVVATESMERPQRMPLGAFLGNPRYLLMLLGTAGSWFLLDYAYYGNTISTPLIIKAIAPHATGLAVAAWSLMIFAVAAVPGYVGSILFMDQIGHRRLQWIGFLMMAVCFLALGAIPALMTAVVPFLLVYAASYFFTEFGPNCTTFVLPSELYPTSMRTTGHGISAGIGKFGAFLGTFLFPLISKTAGVNGAMMISGAFAVIGMFLTMVLPEPTGQSLERISGEVDSPLPASPGSQVAG